MQVRSLNTLAINFPCHIILDTTCVGCANFYIVFSQKTYLSIKTHYIPRIYIFKTVLVSTHLLYNKVSEMK